MPWTSGRPWSSCRRNTGAETLYGTEYRSHRQGGCRHRRKRHAAAHAGGLAFEFLILHHKKSSDIRLGIFCLVVVQDSNYFSPDTGRKRTKAGYHHEGGILPFESLCGKPAYSSGMPALAQASRVAASQTLACTSPMWALPSSSMHRRLWPMPPPME